MHTQKFHNDYTAHIGHISDWQAVYDSIEDKANTHGVKVGETFDYEARNNRTLKIKLFAFTRLDSTNFKYEG